MMIVNNKGETIGVSVIKAKKDGSGLAYFDLLKLDYYSKLDMNEAELMNQGVCPVCGSLLVSGVGSNGEPYDACNRCKFFNE